MKNAWQRFVENHPKAAKWIREGGLFIIVSNLVTVLKYMILQFLPKMLTSLPDTDFGWPGINMTLFGETFKWNILGYDQAHGGLRYFVAYMIAMFIGECINFPIQRSFVFRSKGNIWKQILWYLLAFIVITCTILDDAFRQDVPAVIDCPVDYGENFLLTQRLKAIIDGHSA